MIWEKIIRNSRNSKKTYSGAFVRYDDTPRRGRAGRIVVGDTPKKFKHYMKKLIANSMEFGKEYIFLTAWNEWGEGAYLEPDVDTKYEYLVCLKEAIYEARTTENKK